MSTFIPRGPDSASRHYRADIDGLRAIAVGAVLLYHAFPAWLPGGFVGVDVFFVISGYLISGIILEALRDGRFRFADFYARRIRRIFPALAIVLATVIAGGWFLLYARDYARVSGHVAAGAAFVANFAQWRESSYFDDSADLKPLLHLWSLGVEEQFYLAWPLILWMAARWRRGPIAVTMAIGSVSFVIAIWTVRTNPTAAFFAPWARFWELLAGAMLACAAHGRADDDESAPAAGWIRHAGSVAGLALVGAGVIVIDTTRLFPGLWVVLPVAGTVLLIASGERAIVNRSVLSWPLVVGVGLISYPLYLWHWPLLSFAQILGGRAPSAPVRASLLLLSVGLAGATYRFVERGIRFGPRRGAVVPALTGAMMLLCAAGVTVYANGGFANRALNRQTAGGLIAYYEDMHHTGLAGPYHLECDYLDPDNGTERDRLPPSCTTPGRTHTIMLWGDSFAQALSLGIRESLPEGAAVAQVTTSSCPPEIVGRDTVITDRRCAASNQFAADTMRRLKPDLVIVTQKDHQERVDWQTLAARIIALGAHHVVVVGPSPTWRPSLPRVYAEHHMQDRADYVSIGLDVEPFDVDRLLSDRLSGIPNVTYLSLLAHLCRDHACLARVPGSEPSDLMAVDYGHLSPKGSAYLGRAIWTTLLNQHIP